MTSSIFTSMRCVFVCILVTNALLFLFPNTLFGQTENLSPVQMVGDYYTGESVVVENAKGSTFVTNYIVNQQKIITEFSQYIFIHDIGRYDEDTYLNAFNRVSGLAMGFDETVAGKNNHTLNYYTGYNNKENIVIIFHYNEIDQLIQIRIKHILKSAEI